MVHLCLFVTSFLTNPNMIKNLIFFLKTKPFCTSFSGGLLLCVLRKNDKRRIFLVKNDVRGGISTTTTTTTTRSKLEALEQFVEQFLSNLVSFFFPSVVSSVASKV